MNRTEDDLVAALRVRASTVPDLPPKASKQSVVAAEEALGFSLPPLLRRIYLEVANGGFGPDYGLIGVGGGHLDDQKHNVVDLFLSTCSVEWRKHFPRWPDKTLRVLHWGCAMYTTIDCSTPEYRIFHFEPNPGEEGLGIPNCLIPHSFNLGGFFEAWLDGADIMEDVFPGYNEP
jgi:hypothetical protein